MKLKKVMLGVGVGVLTALFIGFLIEAIYTSPKYEDYCFNQYGMPEAKLNTGALCDFPYDQEMRTECAKNQGNIMQDYDEEGCVSREWCDYCHRDYQNENKKYNRNLFYITAPIGLLLIILGLYLPLSIDAIAGGMLLGGILTMIQITTRVFGNIGKWPRVILLGLELALVIWIGIKKVHEGSRKKK